MQSTDVREAAQQAVSQSKSFVTRQLQAQTSQWGQQIESVATDLRAVSDQLRSNPTAAIAATYVDQGADAIASLGRYVSDADLDRLLADAETFARQQPLVMAAGAFAIGFAASRFIKSSSARRYYEGSDEI